MKSNLREQQLNRFRIQGIANKKKFQISRKSRRNWLRLYKILGYLKLALFWILVEPKLYRSISPEMPQEEIQRIRLPEVYQIRNRRE